MEKKSEIWFHNLLMISLCLAFTFSMGIKTVYNSALVQIRESYSISNLETQIGSFLYYGVFTVAQILFGLFIKKLNMKQVFFWSIVASGICYCCMIFADKAWKLWLLMAINGFLQAPHFSGCIYFVSKFLRGRYRKQATSAISLANPLGTTLATGAVALFTYIDYWKLSFVLLAILMMTSAVMFYYAEGHLEEAEKEEEIKESIQKNASPLPKGQKAALIGTLVALGVVHLLFGGIYTVAKGALSVFLFDWHRVNESLSVLLTICLPILALGVKLFLLYVYFRRKNYLLIAFIADCIALTGTLVLYFVYANSVWVSLLLFAEVYSFTLGAATMLGGSVLSLDISTKIDAGASTALLNAGTSVGCAVFPLISGSILDIGGALSWELLFLFMGIGLFVATAIVLILMTTKRKNTTFNRERKNEGTLT